MARFQHTAARRRLADVIQAVWQVITVSTHSRPKAAGRSRSSSSSPSTRFNTQPPEGGWVDFTRFEVQRLVSTHSRPKAAGVSKMPIIISAVIVSTHSRPKAAGTIFTKTKSNNCSFNTQPPEGGWNEQSEVVNAINGFNTQPPEGGWLFNNFNNCSSVNVSTHSRPKAAGLLEVYNDYDSTGFNTQPPEGGWIHNLTGRKYSLVSTHSRPKAAGRRRSRRRNRETVSTHSRPKAAGYSWF